MDDSVTRLIPLTQIDAVDRLRIIDEAWAEALAAKIEQSEYQAPLLVRPMDGRFRLVIGGHRLEALRRLRWAEAVCEVRDLDDDEARLLEIEENLFRRELNKLDFGIFYWHHKEVEERLGRRSGHGGDRKGSSRKGLQLAPARFTAELAEKIGRSERAVQLAIQIAKNLDPETIAMLRGSKFADNQQTLLELSREQSPSKQRAIARDLVEGRFKTVFAAREAHERKGPPIVIPPEQRRQDNAVEAFAEAWMRLDDDHRLTALREIGLAGQTAAFIKAVRVVFRDDLYGDPVTIPPAPAKSRRGGAR